LMAMKPDIIQTLNTVNAAAPPPPPAAPPAA
jgi:hypothetical protein